MTEKENGKGSPDASTRREFTRVPVKLDFSLFTNQELLCSGQTNNASMAGLHGVSSDAVLPDTECLVQILFGEPENQICIEARGRVVRTTGSGVAVQLTEIDSEGFQHMRNLMLYNSPDPDQVEQEIDSHLGLKRR